MKKGHPFMFRVDPGLQHSSHDLEKGKKLLIDGKEETIHSIHSVKIEYKYVTILGYLAKGEDERE